MPTREVIPLWKQRKFREKLRFIHIKDIDAKVMAEVRRSEMNFDQAIAANVFTIVGQGSVDFPAFFAVAGQQQLLRMDGGGAGRNLWRDRRAAGGECSGQSQVPAASCDDEVDGRRCECPGSLRRPGAPYLARREMWDSDPLPNERDMGHPALGRPDGYLEKFCT